MTFINVNKVKTEGTIWLKLALIVLEEIEFVKLHKNKIPVSN